MIFCRNNSKGFTLIELIVVIAILGILAGILVPTIPYYYEKTNISTAKTDAATTYNYAKTLSTKIQSNMENITDKQGYLDQLISDTHFTTLQCVGIDDVEEPEKCNDMAENDIIIVVSDDLQILRVYTRINDYSVCWNGSVYKLSNKDEAYT